MLPRYCKEHRSINALNIVSLNYADTHSTFQLDFSIKMNDSCRKNISAIEMLDRALNSGIDAECLLVGSWYAKANFINQANELGMPAIARLPKNKLIWNFKGKHKTMNAIYESLKNYRHKSSGKLGKEILATYKKRWNIQQGYKKFTKPVWVWQRRESNI